MCSEVLIVIPVFNESERWNVEYFNQLSSNAKQQSDFLFVDDGSTDESLNLIRDLCGRNDKYGYLALPTNHGKSEATRMGLLKGFELGYSAVGFLDADGAFEVNDVVRIIDVYLEKCESDGNWDSVWSSRLSISGRRIVRNGKRHFVGRLLSHLICLFMEDAPWDTQSGLKIYKGDEKLLLILQHPFKTRWFFELEMLQRYVRMFGASLQIWEEPVDAWTDVKGSKIRFRHAPSIILEMVFIIRTNVKIFTMSLRGN